MAGGDASVTRVDRGINSKFVSRLGNYCGLGWAYAHRIFCIYLCRPSLFVGSAQKNYRLCLSANDTIFHRGLNFHYLIFLVVALLVVSRSHVAIAYDNSVFPPFDMDKVGRGYNWVSIHPDGEQWLISEYLNFKNGERLDCRLFLYNIRTNRYQQYALPRDYIYTNAQFSPSGRLSVAVRSPVAQQSDSAKGTPRSLGESEIITMKVDATEFQVHSIAKGRLKMPTLSNDETRIAYWRASKVRPENAKTLFGGYDLYEHDLQTGTSKLFAGPFNFFLANRIQYLNKDRVLVTAYGPSAYAANYSEYRARFNSSEIYQLNRGGETLPDPVYTDVSNAADAATDQAQTTYVLGMHSKHGISIFRVNRDPAHWRIPYLVPGGISALIPSPDGRYIGFVYPVQLAQSGNPGNGLGIFDLVKESWRPLSLPPPETAMLIPIR